MVEIWKLILHKPFSRPFFIFFGMTLSEEHALSFSWDQFLKTTDIRNVKILKQDFKEYHNLCLWNPILMKNVIIPLLNTCFKVSFLAKKLSEYWCLTYSMF